MIRSISIFLLALFMSYTSSLHAQRMLAFVVDENHEGIADVVVQSVHSGRISITNGEGMFVFDLSLDSVFHLQHISFVSKQAKLTLNSDMTITLMSDPNRFKHTISIYDHRISRQYSNTIAKEELQTVNPQNIRETYNSIPGLFLHTGSLNTNRLVVRGIGSRSPFATTKVRAYLNEIPITNGIGESNLEDISLAMVDQIDIHKGPAPADFGSSLGGVIHYRTKQSDRNLTSIENRFNYSSWNTIHNNLSINLKSKQSIHSLNYELLQSDGYRDNNNYLRSSLTGFSQIYQDKNAFTVFFNHTSLKSQIPSALNIEDFTADPRKAAGNWKAVEGFEDYTRSQVGLSLYHVHNKKWESVSSVFLTSFDNDERRPFNVLRQNSTAIGMRQRMIRYLGSNAQIDFGMEYFHENENWATYQTLEEGSGDILSDNREKRNILQLFTKFHWNYKKFNVDAGLSLNSTNYDLKDQFRADSIDQSGKFLYGPIFNPSLSISREITKANTVYLKIAKGFSVPNLEETLTPTGLINPDILPESGISVELGNKLDFKGYKFNTILYYMWVKNLLVAERVTEDQYIGINAGRTAHPGLELSMQKFFSLKTSSFNFDFSYQYAPHRFTNFINREIDFSDKLLPGNPVQRGCARLNYKWKAISIDLNTHYTGAMFADDSNSINVESSLISNIRTSYNIKLKYRWILNFSFDLNNIFDQKYTSMVAVNPQSFGSNLPRYLYPGLPRNYRVGISIKYQIPPKIYLPLHLD